MARLHKLLALLLLSAVPALAATGSWNGVAFTHWNGVAVTSWNGTSISTAGGGGGATYLIDQDFEGAGYDNGETWTEGGAGTVDEDYTATVLDGSQSLRIHMVGATATTDADFAAQDEVWLYFMVQPVTMVAATRTLASIKSTSTSIAVFRINSPATLTVQSGGQNVTTVGTISAGTTYHVWVRYKKGTGANGVASVAFSTDGTRPTSGNNFAQSTTTTATSQVDRVQIGYTGVGSTQTYVFDKIRVDDAQIGDNPP